MVKKFTDADYKAYIEQYGELPPLPTFNQWYKARWKMLMDWELNWKD